MVINLLESFYLRFPALPETYRSYIAKVLPMLSLVFGVIFLIATILHLIGTSVFSVFTLGGRTATDVQLLLIREVISIGQGLLMIFAVPYLNRREIRGWKLIFYAQILWMLTAILSWSPWLLIAIVLFYFFFQAKKYYR